MRNFNVAGNFNARVFVFSDGIFKCNLTPEFYECISVDSLAQDRGDITKIECPSRYRYGEFQEVYSFSGELSRVTTTITTYMSRVSKSEFLALFEKDCPFDMHVHFGECQNPSDFNAFDKALIFEDVRATSWGTDPVSVLTSGDKGIVNETLDISARKIIELVNLQYAETAGAVTTDGPFVAVVTADSRSCGGDCGVASDGCQVQFAVTDDGILYYTVDGGLTWASEEAIDILTDTTAIPVDLAVVGDTIVILTEDNQIYTSSRTGFLDDPANAVWDATDLTGTLVGTSIDSAFDVAAIVGEAGTVALVDVYGSLLLVENGSATAENLSSVDVHHSGVILAGGENGALIYSSDDGVSWQASPSTPTADEIVSVLVKNPRSWLVGTDTGELWCTDDQGVTWSQVAYPGWSTATLPILDLQANSAHVVFMLQANRLLKSVDGGASWVVEPSNSKKPFPTITAASIGTCWDNINTVTVAGTNAATGALVLGTPNN